MRDFSAVRRLRPRVAARRVPRDRATERQPSRRVGTHRDQCSRRPARHRRCLATMGEPVRPSAGAPPRRDAGRRRGEHPDLRQVARRARSRRDRLGCHRQGVAPAPAVDRGDHRRSLGRAVRHRSQPRRTARSRRGNNRRRQVRAPADARRVPRRGQQDRRDVVRAGRLQGRERIQGVREASAHRRHGDRPRPAAHRARPDVTVRRATPTRAPPARRRMQGHRRLPRGSRRFRNRPPVVGSTRARDR